MVNVLVMGGTEFVGKSLVKGLISKGYIVDFLTRGNKKVDFQGHHKHLICDRKDHNALRRCLEGHTYDYIFDVSAYTCEDVELLLQSINKSSLKRYVFISSAAVYSPSHEFLNENSDRGENPNWGLYGEDKKEAEDYLFERYEKDELPIVIFRPTYIYGEGNNLYRESYFFHRLMSEKPLPVPNTDQSMVQFIHIKDVVEIVIHAITTEKTIGEAYNLTHSRKLSWMEIGSIVQYIVGKGKVMSVNQEKMDALNIKTRQFFPFRDVPILLTTTKLDEHLFLPRIDIEEGLKLSYEWFLKQNIKEKCHVFEQLERVVT
ncbi:NAD-dependent epimerase/dehydratase family protein [Chengkuizengella axinellae]|uniref:NAD-dependent epimerase/dehydratase family protein n=1 Tax=Chengkuizengella axinellae TaxID=3064388 RepID=A0ABT9IW52_9BACL|nr:NAD-dependent epimerase/dehydratase family protein [Chengkuizengella sp. 2205SS18-9]MDP5273596.1 NAD-dependent epimerase/dehydratase family protein [Chengkuizengella sp. 2205SS18-9]